MEMDTITGTGFLFKKGDAIILSVNGSLRNITQQAPPKFGSSINFP